MTGAPEGSIESGSGEAGDRTWVRKYLQLYAQKFGLSIPVYFHVH